jgi:hypothetical protein
LLDDIEEHDEKALQLVYFSHNFTNESLPEYQRSFKTRGTELRNIVYNNWAQFYYTVKSSTSKDWCLRPTYVQPGSFDIAGYYLTFTLEQISYFWQLLGYSTYIFLIYI